MTANPNCSTSESRSYLASTRTMAIPQLRPSAGFRPCTQPQSKVRGNLQQSPPTCTRSVHFCTSSWLAMRRMAVRAAEVSRTMYWSTYSGHRYPASSLLIQRRKKNCWVSSIKSSRERCSAIRHRGDRSVAEMSQGTERCLNGAALLSENFSTATSDKEGGAGNSRVGAGSRRRWYIAAAIVGVMVLAGAVLSRGPGVRWLQSQRIGKVTPAAPPGIPAETVRSIAVLPFEPLGKDMNDELLGLGMADAIIGRMSNLKQLAVLPTSAVSKYKGSANDPLAAGRALGVDAVRGTVQRIPATVSAPLSSLCASRAAALFGRRFDQTFTDIFGIQDSISDKVARSLVRDLSEEQQKQLSKHYTNNIAAYKLLSNGIPLLEPALKRWHGEGD